MKRYVSVAMLGLALTAAGCSDVLTTVPQDRIQDEEFWTKTSDFVMAVNAAYRDIQGGQNTLQPYLDGATDIAYSQQYWAPQGLWARGTEVATSGYTGNFWQRYYRGINRTNTILKRLQDTVTFTQTQRDEIEGQARFLRAYYYSDLLWMYGDVPLVLEPVSIEESRALTRATREQVYNQIMTDLDAAIAKLPTTYPSGSTSFWGQTVSRATKYSALAYKARAALYEGTYQKYGANNLGKATPMLQTARDAAKAVMDGGYHALYTTGATPFRDLFTYVGEGNREVIFDYVRVTGQNGWAAWQYWAPVTMNGTTEGTTPTRALVDMFYMKDGKCPAQHAQTKVGCPVDVLGVSSLYQADPTNMYKDRDPRFYGTVLYPTASFNNTTYNSFPDSPTGDRLDRGNFYNTHTGYLFLKYVDPADRNRRSNVGINFILMRYADVLLMYAEAKTELGEVDATVAGAINQLRKRVGMPENVTVLPQAQMLKLIRNERAVELADEGLRLADIRRWRIGQQVMPGRVYGIDYLEGTAVKTAQGDDIRQFTTREYLFPVPQRERDLNSNLTQNPGF